MTWFAKPTTLEAKPGCTCPDDLNCTACHVYADLDDQLRCTACEWVSSDSGALEDLLAAAIGHTGWSDEMADCMWWENEDPEGEAYVATLRRQFAAGAAP